MSGRKVFTAGEVLQAADVNDFLMDQSVMVFAGTAARGSAISSPTEGMVTYLADSDSLEVYTTSWGPIGGGFTAATAITATDASWTVPSLGNSVVRITAVGAGGGGGAPAGTSGSAGGSTSFASSAGTVSATGGAGGPLTSTTTTNGFNGTAGLVSSNGGSGASSYDGGNKISYSAHAGQGGQVTVAYLDLSGVSTANVSIGAGGSPGSGGATPGTGGNGVVIFEYVAGA